MVQKRENYEHIIAGFSTSDIGLMIAAEKTGRCTYAIEYESKFVNAAIYRWEKFTGEKAVKVPS